MPAISITDRISVMLTMQRRLLAAFAACVLCGLAAATSVAGADQVPAERRLPPGTSVFLSVPDAAEAHERLMRSSFGQLLQDDALEPFREEIAQWWEKASEEAEQELGIPPSDLLPLLHGELAFAVTQPPGKDLGAVFFLDFGEHRDTLETLLEKAQENLEDKAERSVESIQDTDVTVYVFDESEEGEGTGSLAYFIRDQSFVMAFVGGKSGAGLLEEILLRWDGDHEQTFADEDTYERLMLKCQPDGGESPQIRWYFSPVDLFKAVADSPQAQASRAPVQPRMLLPFLSMLGLDGFQAVGGTATLMTEEFDSVSRTFLAVDQPLSGVLKIFEFPATSQQPPRWVPAEAAGYSTVNWDVEGAFDAVEALVDQFQPPGTFHQLIDQLAQQGPQIHVKDDLIDSLTGRIQTLGELRDDVDLAKAAAQPLVIALELSNESKMSEVLKKVDAAMEDKLETRDFRGVTIYEMEIPNFQGGPPQSMGVAVARGQLFFATDVQLLEQYLRDDQDAQPLANSSDYRRVASHFPSRTSILSFQRPAAQLKPYYETFRNGELDAVITEIDFSKLPEFEQIAKYFNLTGSYAVPDDDGALFVNFGLHGD
jgi:hypothetical protein